VINHDLSCILHSYRNIALKSPKPTTSYFEPFSQSEPKHVANFQLEPCHPNFIHFIKIHERYKQTDDDGRRQTTYYDNEQTLQ